MSLLDQNLKNEIKSLYTTSRKPRKFQEQKKKRNYTAPYTVEEVTLSCLIARKDQNSKATKLPIHLSKISLTQTTSELTQLKVVDC